MGIIGRLWNLGKGTWKVRTSGSGERISEAELEAELAQTSAASHQAAPAAQAEAPKPAEDEASDGLPEPERDADGKVIKTL